MLIVTARNLTGTKPDGTSDYAVQVRITTSRTTTRLIADLMVRNHLRVGGGPQFLRRIAEVWEQSEIEGGSR